MRALDRTPERTPAAGAGRGGFSLIELLAVLVIISILAYFLVVSMGGAREVVEVGLTRSRIAELGTMLSAWTDEQGDYPLSTFEAGYGAAPNALNLGAECLYLALCAEGRDGQGVLDEQLENTDGDRLSARVAGFESLELFEISDDWGNPIAYQHHRDYGRKDLYLTLDPDTGEELESVVEAAKSSKTRRYHQPQGFQLVSAGPDGHFGTDDDITNFKD
jgi:prepilin-type N-terminal cleavage/methylation domain-containing protein